ncbi:MAG: DUF167 domain-containing protein [Burkholderiales bacterium]|nr:DUF167 domain-containing protein [Burkholderiales bacterium]
MAATRLPLAPGALPCWARSSEDGRGLVLTLHVRPLARASGPDGRHGDALKLRIAAPALDNRANDALVEFLHRGLALPRAAVRIAHGVHSRRKVIAIDANSRAIVQRLRAWDAGRDA